MILGVDVWDGYDRVKPIDWDVAAGAGVRFAIAKCTVGNEPNKDDRSFARNVAGCRRAGIPVGMYHFGFPLRSGQGLPGGRSPKEQAERAFAVSKGLGGDVGDLPPALDFEWPPKWEDHDKDPSTPLVDRWKQWDIDAPFMCDWALEWLAYAEVLWGVLPMIYEYPDFRKSLGGHGRNRAFARYPLWIATYPESGRNAWLPPEGAKPIVHPPFDDWAIWQFAADGSPVRIPGISAAPIDRDCMRDEATLRRLTRVGEPPPVSVETTWEIAHPDVPLSGLQRYEPEPEDPDDVA